MISVLVKSSSSDIRLVKVVLVISVLVDMSLHSWKIRLCSLIQESISDELDPSLPTLQDLGVTPENIEDIVSFVYGSFRNAGIFQEAMGLISHPEKPPSLYATLR